MRRSSFSCLPYPASEVSLAGDRIQRSWGEGSRSAASRHPHHVASLASGRADSARDARVGAQHRLPPSTSRGVVSDCDESLSSGNPSNNLHRCAPGFVPTIYSFDIRGYLREPAPGTRGRQDARRSSFCSKGSWSSRSHARARCASNYRSCQDSVTTLRTPAPLPPNRGSDADLSQSICGRLGNGTVASMGNTDLDRSMRSTADVQVRHLRASPISKVPHDSHVAVASFPLAAQPQTHVRRCTPNHQEGELRLFLPQCTPGSRSLSDPVGIPSGNDHSLDGAHRQRQSSSECSKAVRGSLADITGSDYPTDSKPPPEFMPIWSLAATTKPHRVPHIEFDTLPSSSNTSQVVYYVEGQRHVVRLGKTPCCLPLAPIVDSCLDLDKLLYLHHQHFPESQLSSGVLSFLTSPVLTDAMALFKAPRKVIAPSRHFSEDDIDLIFSTCAEDSDPADIDMFMSCFKVPKSSNVDSRLVADGREFDTFVRSIYKELGWSEFKMNIPSIETVTQMGLSYKIMFTKDATSFFYQILVPRRLRRYFGIRLASRRGKFRTGRLKKLPMGTHFSPSAACDISNSVLDILKARCPAGSTMNGIHVGRWDAVCWVDNFIFFADDEDTAQVIRDEFDKLCEEINLICKAWEFADSEGHIKVLGMLFKPGEYVLPPEVPSALSHGTARSFLIMFGGIMWANSTVGRLPLCFFPALMDFIRLLCSEQDWEKHYSAPREVLMETINLVQLLRESRLLPQHVISPVPASYNWSDASSYFLACVHQTLGKDNWFAVPTPESFWNGDVFNIFVAESSAWALGHLHYPQPQPCASIVDNQPLARAIFRGHSGSAATDAILAHVIRNRFQDGCHFIGWVPTDEMRADIPSRTATATTLPPKEPSVVRTRWRRIPG